MPVGHSKPHRTGEDARFNMSGFFFVLSLFVYLLTALGCILVTPHVRVEAGGVPMKAPLGKDVACLRATRHADYVTVDVPVGTPFKVMTVLLRLDSVKGADDTTLQLFAQEIVESATVDCESTTNQCEDVMLLALGGPSGKAVPVVARFHYQHHTEVYSVASALPGVDGELFLLAETQYWLTATHFCYAPTTAAHHDLTNTHVQAKHTPEDGIVATRTQLSTVEAEALGAPSIDSELTAGCAQTDIVVFPTMAAVEPSYLTISDMTLYNSEPASVSARRTVVELGEDCAAQTADLERDLMLYKVDCKSIGVCRTAPSLPFRRLATSSLHVVVSADATVVAIAAKRDPSLNGLARLTDSASAFGGSLVKLGMITLAAAVVYVRSQRPTASSSWLFKHAVRTASRCGHETTGDVDKSYTLVSDVFVGMIAITARGGISILRWQSLMEDGQWRVPVSEVLATAFSLLHLFNRYFGFEIDVNDPPISKLGGATAIIDSSCAVMVAFAEAPIMVVSIGKFNPTARLLTALLISLIVATRCSFSAACCGVLWESEDCKDQPRYGRTLLLTGFMWAVIQSSALAIIVVDLFVTPSSFSMSRATPGEMLSGRLLLFLTLACAGLPRFMRTIRHILSPRNDHVD